MGRLDTVDGQLEFGGTTAALAAHLPGDGHVLDAGVGAGRYAVWLAERGCEVTLLDVSRRQVTLARERAADRGLASPLHDDQLEADLGDFGDRERAALERTLDLTNDEPAAVDVSEHLLAIGRA